MAQIDSPFKFLDPYEKADAKKFFGRDKEIDDLEQMLYKSNILLVYGRSGSGKTSLIQCGLADRMDQSGWLEAAIRRNDNINDSLIETLTAMVPESTGLSENLLASYFDDSSVEPGEPEGQHQSDPAEGEAIELIRRIHSFYFKPIYLIFDQFEELFILSNNPDELKTFYKTISEILESCPYAHMIFIMREEFIARLYNFEKVVPTIFTKRLRVEPLDQVNTIDVIERTIEEIPNIKLGGEKVPAAIVEAISSGQSQMEMTYLQVFLDAMFRQAVKKNISPIVFTRDLVKELGGIEDVLKIFLQDQAASLQQDFEQQFPDSPENTVFNVLHSFVTLQGTKQPVNPADLVGDVLSQDAVDFIFDHLGSARIIRRKQDQDNHFELSHDTLAKRIGSWRSPEDLEYLSIVDAIRSTTLRARTVDSSLNHNELDLIDRYQDRLHKDASITEEHWQFVQRSKEKLLAERRKSQRLQNALYSLGGLAIVALIATFGIFQKSNFDDNLESAAVARADGAFPSSINFYRSARRNVWSLSPNYSIRDSIRRVAQMRYHDSIALSRHNMASEINHAYGSGSTDKALVARAKKLIEAYNLYSSALELENKISGATHNRLVTNRDELRGELHYIGRQLYDSGHSMYYLKDPVANCHCEVFLSTAMEIDRCLGIPVESSHEQQYEECKANLRCVD